MASAIGKKENRSQQFCNESPVSVSLQINCSSRGRFTYEIQPNATVFVPLFLLKKDSSVKFSLMDKTDSIGKKVDPVDATTKFALELTAFDESTKYQKITTDYDLNESYDHDTYPLKYGVTYHLNFGRVNPTLFTGP